ncbi:MAG: hypothetical protein HY815_34340 [Candidatus Riflebacteria bacterium]|nr:hypothetical protein [Candidatus Riflebacteria bacterium]
MALVQIISGLLLTLGYALLAAGGAWTGWLIWNLGTFRASPYRNSDRRWVVVATILLAVTPIVLFSVSAVLLLVGHLL